MKVLLVDDDAAYREIFQCLTKGKLEVVTAVSLADAVSKLSTQRVDCVVLDLNLPDSNPEETVRSFKRSYPSAICVALSGNSNPALVAASIRGGAHWYLHKGKSDLDGDSILRAISEAVTHKLV